MRGKKWSGGPLKCNRISHSVYITCGHLVFRQHRKLSSGENYISDRIFFPVHTSCYKVKWAMRHLPVMYMKKGTKKAQAIIFLPLFENLRCPPRFGVVDNIWQYLSWQLHLFTAHESSCHEVAHRWEEEGKKKGYLARVTEWKWEREGGIWQTGRRTGMQKLLLHEFIQFYDCLSACVCVRAQVYGCNLQAHRRCPYIVSIFIYFHYLNEVCCTTDADDRGSGDGVIGPAAITVPPSPLQSPTIQ